MKLDHSLLKEFAKTVNTPIKEDPKYLRGTAKVSGNSKYVRIDGSKNFTPIDETVDIQDGDRVLVTIEDHVATVIGNLTFPPNARKEDEALNNSNDANSKADSALEDSNIAKSQANEALTKATNANTAADGAKQKAEEAVASAEEAKQSATTANQNADSAKDIANQSKTESSDAKQKATSAQENISKVENQVAVIKQDTIEAKRDADKAVQDAKKANDDLVLFKSDVKKEYSTKTELADTQSTLENSISQTVTDIETHVKETYAAKTDLTSIKGELQTSINQNAEDISSQASRIEVVEADTANAQKDINTAKSEAAEAKSIANTASENAVNAQEAADNAIIAANSADQKAIAAQNAFDEAQQLAAKADKDIQDAKTLLNEAKHNLEVIKSDPTSTEEAIQNAENQVKIADANVTTAMEKAGSAAAAANDARIAADKAAEEAETAKGTATDAASKANLAKKAADDAKRDSVAAQQDVAELTSRVDTAESKITQNADKIESNVQATTEIGDRLTNDYYTNEKVETLISQSAGSIKTEVSNTYSQKANTIAETEKEYYLSSSKDTPLNGEWSSKPPKWVQGSYIWERTAVTYGDGRCIYIPSKNGVCVIGVSEGKGDPGVGIKDITVSYGVSDSSDTKPESWFPDVPSYVEEGQYLWTKNVISYTDPSLADVTTWTYSKQGSNGSNGRSIESITVEYYLSTSKVDQIGGEWKESPDRWESGKYLWTRSKIVYKDPADTEYTTPVCSTEWEELDKKFYDDLKNMQTNITEAYTTAINQNDDRIMLNVESKITESNDRVSDMIQKNTVEITDNYTKFVQESEKTITDGIAYNANEISKIQKYVQINGDTLELGSSDNKIKCVITPNELAFYQSDSSHSGNKIAYFSGRELYVLRAIIGTSLGCGNFTFIDEGEDLGFSLL